METYFGLNEEIEVGELVLDKIEEMELDFLDEIVVYYKTYRISITKE